MSNETYEYAVSHEVAEMCVVKNGPNHGPAPLPEEGMWVNYTYFRFWHTIYLYIAFFMYCSIFFVFLQVGFSQLIYFLLFLRGFSAKFITCLLDLMAHSTVLYAPPLVQMNRDVS